MTEKLSWLEPGVEVVVFSAGLWSPDARVTTVKRVNKVTFTIEESTTKFYVRDGRSQGSDSWTRGVTVVLRDSDEGRRELEKVKHYKRRLRAQNCYERWNRKSTRQNRQALIDALNAITQDEES